MPTPDEGPRRRHARSGQPPGRPGGVSLIPSAGFVAITVPLVVFLALQRYFIRGTTAGAVTG